MTATDDDRAQELGFHLRALRLGLRAGLTEVRGLREEPVAPGHARDRLASLVSLVDDDLVGHARRALALAEPMGGTAPASSDVAGIGGERAEAIPALPEQLIALERALTAASDAANAAEIAHTGPDQVDSLRRAADLLVIAAGPIARAALATARSLERAADPIGAAADDRADELATPLGVQAREDARTLTVCPSCGAPLGAGDRTFDGSYCEACRTRFVAPAGGRPAG